MVRQAHHERRSEDFEKALNPHVYLLCQSKLACCHCEERRNAGNCAQPVRAQPAIVV